MSFRIFITGVSLVEEAMQILADKGCIVEIGDPLDQPGTIARKLKAFKPDAMIVRQGNIGAAALEAAPGLKVICKHGVGVDNIDVTAATKRKIPVMVTMNANFESVAEHALAMVLALLKRIPTQHSNLQKGIFNKVGYEGEDLIGLRVGIIGFGRIGKRFEELIRPFNPVVTVYDPYLREPLPSKLIFSRSLERICEEADIIALFCKLTKETKGMINKERIDLMKPSAYIINVSRGAIINESDLIEALINNHIAGAALDTFEQEPPSRDNPLLKMDNVVLTSHVGGASRNALRRMGVDAVKNVLSMLTGVNPDYKSIVNNEVLDANFEDVDEY